METFRSSIAEHGLIGNTRTAALISKNGSLDWCCFPRFDSPSFFAALLDDKEGGHFTIRPKNEFRSFQQYMQDTNVLETIFETTEGDVLLTDCFPVDSEENKHGELWPLHEVLRIVDGLSGDVEMAMTFIPKPGYGQAKIKITKTRKFGLRCDLGKAIIFLNHSLRVDEIKISPNKNEAEAIFKISKGERIIFSLLYSEEAPTVVPPLGTFANDRLNRTIKYWRDWVSRCKYSGEYIEDVKRSALALKLLVFAPSGAILAAPTTSLPEELQGIRNWDYRYCWLRDTSLTVRALVDLGFYDEANAYMSWILHSTSLTRPRLQVVYTIFGEAKIPEKILSWFSGYRNSAPVRIGNAADKQFQLDVYGEVMHAIYIMLPHMKEIDRDTVNFITDIGKAVCDLWNLPDEGIWETRAGKVHHTHSKAMAWIALDRLIKICQGQQWNIPLDEFKETASELKASLEEHGYNEELKSYTATYDGHEVDASLLMLALMDYDPHSSERLFNTVMKIKKDLSRNGLVYRNITGDDGLPSGEGTFGACSFWLVDALARFGLSKEASLLFKDLLKRRNSVGLWPEEISPEDNEFLGNYPQSFTHTALIGAALSLKKGASYERQ